MTHNYNYRRTWKELGRRTPVIAGRPAAGWREGEGRFWKSQLASARRRAVRLCLRGHRARWPVGLESAVSWRAH